MKWSILFPIYVPAKEFLFDVCFDFCLFDDDGKIQSLIEYQGRQHYEAVSKFGGYKGYYQQKHNDDMKRRYCFLHNIPLIEIPYTDENKISYDYIIQKTGY